MMPGPCETYIDDRKTKCGSTTWTRRGTSKTLMGFSAPPGHDHDGNRYTAAYECERGHYGHGEIVLGPPCPVEGCDWKPPTHWMDDERERKKHDLTCLKQQSMYKECTCVPR